MVNYENHSFLVGELDALIKGAAKFGATKK